MIFKCTRKVNQLHPLYNRASTHKTKHVHTQTSEKELHSMANVWIKNNKVGASSSSIWTLTWLVGASVSTVVPSVFVHVMIRLEHFQQRITKSMWNET